jgi:hypothetical protein
MVRQKLAVSSVAALSAAVGFVTAATAARR